MLQLPIFYGQHQNSPLDSVYKALHNKDLAKSVAAAVDVLRMTNNFVKIDNKGKQSQAAIEHGVEGKKAFCEGDFQLALVKYNMAIMRAPSNSEAMRLAYYSRAELLLKAKQFKACVKDVETCLALSCPETLATKLREMRAAASQFTWLEEFAVRHAATPFTEHYFKLKGDSHPDIPCAISDVEVIVESGQVKIVAARDIPVGTLVALETAFVAAEHIMNHVTSCHYCLKMSFNLIPCDGCSAAFFCDKTCKEKSMREGHNIACKIMDVIIDDVKLPVKAVLKIRQLCDSWEEFIIASYDLGTDRMKNATIADIFGSDKFSLLNSNYDTHFKYGALFNRSMYFANIIHYLDMKTSFFPTAPEKKKAAIDAVSRMLMHLSVYCTPVQLQYCTSMCVEGRVSLHNHPNKGYFPFMSKLAHSCVPNLYVAGLRNSAALVSVMPIKKGEELTISYSGHWLEVQPSENRYRAKKMFVHYRTICQDCKVCSEDDSLRKQSLSDEELKAYHTFIIHHPDTTINFPQNIATRYKDTCKILQKLSKAPFSKEYALAFVALLHCLMHCIEYKYPNVIMNQYE
ncbi:SET and MYND domain-containing protein 4-like [Helicoverpa zea]|uniref:SET and MYND domain-containing protein 4-like n=1 Tax=Helicoverpa zea TaxID=7113 RepID=UPI001F582C36|nr:SET and MYND domain-containing protein 4-like [Helicoverpa zea]